MAAATTCDLDAQLSHLDAMLSSLTGLEGAALAPPLRTPASPLLELVDSLMKAGAARLGLLVALTGLSRNLRREADRRRRELVWLGLVAHQLRSVELLEAVVVEAQLAHAWAELGYSGLASLNHLLGELGSLALQLRGQRQQLLQAAGQVEGVLHG